MGEAKMDEPTKSMLKKELEEMMAKTLVKGDTWYLIGKHWFRQLSEYLNLSGLLTSDGFDSNKPGSGDDASYPGPIDNADLLKNSNNKGENVSDDLKDHLLEEVDYHLVPEEAWNLLTEHFGVVKGQPSIPRKVVEHGMFVKNAKVEVYLCEVTLADYRDKNKTKTAKFSKEETLGSIVSTMRKMFSIDDNIEVRLWIKYSGETTVELTEMNKSANDAGVYSGNQLLIEPRNSDGTWPAGVKIPVGKTSSNITSSLAGLNSNSSLSITHKQNQNNSSVLPSTVGPISTRYNYSSYDGRMEKVQPGLCGLSNLGNTCFMNSIIQGLSNCPPIAEYFANDNYVEDINEENPLGMRGEIARTFGELIKSIWSGKFSYIVPRNFKTAVGRFAPSFSGYQQQDSQELLTFLLDGLHEDLNRIRKKPYIELKDSDDRPDEVVAGEAWENYKKRNDSVILDLFHGLLKSTVVCPVCPKVSVTFDPFCYLSLPLPVKKERKIEVFLVYQNPHKCPIQFRVTVEKNGCMRDLCKALSTMSDVDADRMVVTDVYNNRFHKIYSSDEPLTHILERDDIFIYEVPTTNFEDPKTVIVPVYLRERKSASPHSPLTLFGQPFLIGVPRDGLTYDQLYERVLAQLSRCVTPPGKDDATEWWKTSSENTNGDISSLNNNTEKDSSEEATTPSSEGASDNVDEDDDEMGIEEDEGKGPPKLFVMNFVNSYASSCLEQLRNNGKPLKITGKYFLSLDWHPKAKELFYNEKKAEEIKQDPSLETKAIQKKAVKLEDCLELYTTKEKLGENDAWYCPSCKKHQQATKKFDIWSLPALLVISLKRFSYNRFWRDKLDTMVEFPVKNLDMTPYIINKNHGPAVYDLVAASNHYGGMGGGHYTAFAKSRLDGRWYYYDDSSVTSASEESVVSKAAYVLFYQRRDLAESQGVNPKNSKQTAICNGHSSTNGGIEDEAMDVN